MPDDVAHEGAAAARAKAGRCDVRGVDIEHPGGAPKVSPALSGNARSIHSAPSVLLRFPVRARGAPDARVRLRLSPPIFFIPGLRGPASS
ncbi:MAG: hypothetical protein LBU11_11715, partial [Zoogloeaceae bacterium]|nr:hypothetical protein [Zoogloeaceae bacterium]